MAITPQINAPQAAAMSVDHAVTPAILAPQARPMAVFNVPSVAIRSSAAASQVPIRQTAGEIKAEQATMMVVCGGRSANPRIRTWTFTLDGHDFFVLRLGDNETLIYDATTQRWVEWTSDTLNFWRVNTGLNWIGGEAFGQKYGTNIVAGDDTYGLLWFLDPNQGFDDHPDYLNPAQQVSFPRIVTGQVATQGRDSKPCYALFLDGDNYGLVATDFVPAIMLEISDDQGQTFVTLDTLPVIMDPSQDSPYTWYSLGQVQSPGRIFRITDNGVLARVDGMDMNDDGG